ncbi:MAG: hypothetical protein M3Z35_16625, partial [Nitrospirota bacterium]|nr:hypothetical protein [Nitrospirota bacterium]
APRPRGPGVPPGPASIAKGEITISNGGALDATGQKIVLGQETGSEGILNVRNASSTALCKDIIIGSLGKGTLLVEDTAMLHNTGDAIVGEQAGGTGNATITGAGTKWQIDGDLIIGLAGDMTKTATGQVTVKDGAILTVNGADLSIGYETGSIGTLTIDGFQSKITGMGATNVAIGRRGTGTLQLLNGGQFSVRSLTLGTLDGGSGNVKVDGNSNGTASTLEVLGSLTVAGVSGGTGEIDITNGGQVIARNNAIIARDASSTGVVFLSGKDSVWNIIAGGATGDLTVGQAGNGTLEITNNASLSVRAFVVAQDSPQATVNVTAGGHLTTETATIGKNIASDGSVKVTGTGSEWDPMGAVIVGDSGQGDLNVNSSAKVVMPNFNLAVGNNLLGTVEVDNATLGAQNIEVGINGTGTVTVSRSGTVTAQHIDLGFNSSSTGNLVIDGTARPNNTPATVTVGSLTVGVFGNGNVSVNTGGVLLDSGLMDVGSHPGSVGMLTVDGKGPDGAGSLVATNGTLSLGVNGGSGTMQVTNSGVVQSSGGRIDGANSSATITGTGSFWQIGSNELVVGATHGGTLSVTNGGTVSVDGAATFGLSSNATVTVDNATLEVRGFNPLTIGANGPVSMFVKNGGSFTGFTANIGGHSLVQVFGDNSEFAPSANTTLSDQSLLEVFSNGHVTTGFLNVGVGTTVDVTQGGSIDIATGSSKAAPGTISVNPVGILKDNGAVNGNVIAQFGGTVGGAGTINGKLINGGKVSPNDPQTLTVNGDYQQLNGGLLQIAIAGKT